MSKEEIQMELDLQILEAKILGVDQYACLEANLAGFKPMRWNYEKFTCEEVVLWLKTLSTKSKCSSLFWCAGEYAQRFVVDDDMDDGRSWLRESKEYLLAVMKEVAGCDGREHYEVLERFGFDRGTNVPPSEGAGVATLEAHMISLQKTPDEQRTAETVPRGDPDGTGTTQMHMVQRELDLRELQKEVNDMRAGTLEALKQGQYQYAEHDGTLEALKHGAGGHELQKRVDEMRELQKRLDDLRAGDKTLEALSLSQYELQQMANDMREMCAAGSGGGVGILEEQMNTLQKIGDEMRAGDTLEALKQGILNRKQIIGEGTMVLHEYEVCAGGKIIKVHTVEIEQDPEVEGGKEDIMISEKITAEQKSVARGLIDPGGGANTYMYAGEGKILYPEFTGTWRRNNPGEGQSALAGGEHNEQVRGGKIKDPGKGGNIDHEVPRTVYEVQEIQNRWGINEDAEETRKRRDEKVIRTSTASENSNENGPDGTGSKGDTGGKGSNEKENREEPKKKKWAEQMANDMDNHEMCGKISVA
jgi:hypothetical protein